MIKRFLFCALFVVTTTVCFQSSAGDVLTRQQFSILKDGEDTVVAAELLIGGYPENTFRSIVSSEEPSKFTNSCEGLVVRQAQLFSEGNLPSVLLDFKDDERVKAQRVFNNPKRLMALYTNVMDFRFISKGQFGPVIMIRYETGLNHGHRITMSSYLIVENDRYKFISEPPEVLIFSRAAAKFPSWKPQSQRAMQKNGTEKMLETVFYYRDKEEFSDSRLVLKYRLSGLDDHEQSRNSVKQIDDFLKNASKAHIKGDTNAIISAWRSGRDRVLITKALERGQYLPTADFLKKLGSGFTVQFFIKAADEFWVFVTTGKGDIGLVRLAVEGGKFTLAGQFDEAFVDQILSSQDLVKRLQRHVH